MLYFCLISFFKLWPPAPLKVSAQPWHSSFLVYHDLIWSIVTVHAVLLHCQKGAQAAHVSGSSFQQSHKFILLLCLQMKRKKKQHMDALEENYDSLFGKQILESNPWPFWVAYMFWWRRCSTESSQRGNYNSGFFFFFFFRTVRYDELISCPLSFPCEAWQLM